MFILSARFPVGVLIRYPDYPTATWDGGHAPSASSSLSYVSGSFCVERERTAEENVSVLLWLKDFLVFIERACLANRIARNT